MTPGEPWLDALSAPGAYPWPVDHVEAISTHISRVFLAGDRVIKLKRPVRFSFVDYSTPDLRRAACEDEVRLNRLLTDDVYLGVVPIVRDGNRFRIGQAGDAEVVVWATLMRRLDASEMLHQRLARDDTPADLAARLAERLLPFHLERIPRCAGADDEVHAAQSAVLTENLDDLAPFAGSPLPALAFHLLNRAVRSFLDAHRDLLLARIAAGWSMLWSTRRPTGRRASTRC